MMEIAILSGKGGTGKTSLSAALATINHQTVVADCDVDTANLYLILQPENYIEEKILTGHKAVIDYSSCNQCGLCIDYSRFDAIAYVNGRVTISETACDGCKLCSRVCPLQSITMIPSDKSCWYIGNYRNGKMIHARLAPGEENSGKLVNVVREQARNTAKESGWGIVIIDGPPGTGCPVISTLTGVNKVIAVTEPTRTGFHDLKRIVDLTKEFNIPTYIVVNKYDLNENMTDEILVWCSEMGLPVIGKISFEPQIVEAMLQCKSIVEWAPETQAAKEIYAIYQQVVNDKIN